MGSYSDFKGFNGDLMGFYGALIVGDSGHVD